MSNEPIQESAGQNREPRQFTLVLSIESRLDLVWMIRAAVAGILSDLRAPSDEIFLIQLAVSEIVNNVIEHGYRGQSDNRLDISIQGAGAELRIDVADDAPPLSAEHLECLLTEGGCGEDSDESWPERGHGFQVVRRAVDSVSYCRIGNRNRMTLVKQISVNCSND